jgi:hypothetical protein
MGSSKDEVDLMFVFGILTAITGAKNGHNPGGSFSDGFSFMVVSVFDILLFLLFFIFGKPFRKISNSSNF